MAKTKTKADVARIGVVMGSRSDWETMKAASETLDRLGISHEVEVVSAPCSVGVVVTSPPAAFPPPSPPWSC